MPSFIGKFICRLDNVYVENVMDNVESESESKEEDLDVKNMVWIPIAKEYSKDKISQLPHKCVNHVNETSNRKRNNEPRRSQSETGTAEFVKQSDQKHSKTEEEYTLPKVIQSI
eukprot:512531_1